MCVGKQIGLVTLFLVSLFATACDEWEIVSNHYANYEEAQNSNAFRVGGWLPSLIPTTALSISETHDIDTNATWIGFSLPLTDGEFDIEGCVASKEVPAPPPRPRWSGKLSWWPTKDVERFVNAGEHVFECGDDFFGAFFLSKGQAEVFLWSKTLN